MNLTDLKARNIKPNDRPIADGTVPGLRLHPGKKKGQGKWLMRFVSPETNKRREMGLGVFSDVSISDARRAASAARALRGYQRDLCERALSHTIHNQAEAAYHRTDLLDQRRIMIESWAQYVCGIARGSDKIVAFSGGTKKKI